MWGEKGDCNFCIGLCMNQIFMVIENEWGKNTRENDGSTRKQFAIDMIE